jgi:hypothetical protein
MSDFQGKNLGQNVWFITNSTNTYRPEAISEEKIATAAC